jgi:hypothetical protein
MAHHSKSRVLNQAPGCCPSSWPAAWVPNARVLGGVGERRGLRALLCIHAHNCSCIHLKDVQCQTSSGLHATIADAGMALPQVLHLAQCHGHECWLGQRGSVARVARCALQAGLAAGRPRPHFIGTHNRTLKLRQYSHPRLWLSAEPLQLWRECTGKWLGDPKRPPDFVKVPCCASFAVSGGPFGEHRRGYLAVCSLAAGQKHMAACTRPLRTHFCGKLCGLRAAFGLLQATKEAILRRPLDFYLALREWLTSGEMESKWAGISVEFHWPLILTNQTVFESPLQECLCDLYSVCNQVNASAAAAGPDA